MIAQEHIVIFASCHLQEVSTCHRLWNLDSVESGKDLRATLSSRSGHWHLSSELTFLRQTKGCAEYAIVLHFKNVFVNKIFEK